MVKNIIGVSSSRKVSHGWLATLQENNEPNNKNNASGPKKQFYQLLL